MGKERENIFSWRKELKGIAPKERVNWFYNDKLIPSLSDSVAEAERCRQGLDHKGVEEVWSHLVFSSRGAFAET